MTDRQFDTDEIETEELDLESGDEASLEDAMKEALEAVEQGDAGSGEEDPFGPVDSSSVASGGEKVEELQARLVRTLADFDNFRKRVDRERSDQQRYAGAEVLRDVLAVIDNLERASQAEGDVGELREGVELILRQMADLVRRHGAEQVPSEGERFDPAVHEAVVRHESDEVAEPMVVKVLQTGYWLRDRLLRPALVEVAVPANPSPANDAESEGES